jgi:hypothetical protein
VLERDIESWSVRRAEKAGYWCRKFKAPGRRSAPDRVFARNGRVFFVEFKATGEEPTELQEEEHRKMRSAGLTVYWTDSRDGFAFILAMEESGDWGVCDTTEGYGVTGDKPDLKFHAYD